MAVHLKMISNKVECQNIIQNSNYKTTSYFGSHFIIIVFYNKNIPRLYKIKNLKKFLKMSPSISRPLISSLYKNNIKLYSFLDIFSKLYYHKYMKGLI